MFFGCLLIFRKINFLKSSFRNNIRVSSSLDPDQARQFVGPDLGPNCLQRLSADDTSRQKVKQYFLFNHCLEFHQTSQETDMGGRGGVSLSHTYVGKSSKILSKATMSLYK